MQVHDMQNLEAEIKWKGAQKYLSRCYWTTCSMRSVMIKLFHNAEPNTSYSWQGLGQD